MNPDFEADTDAMRRAAAALDSTADRVRGAAGAAPVPDPTPRWATTGASDLATTAARQLVDRLAGDVEATARGVREVAEAYEEADARAAARLRPTR
ncbi:type VII secretion target [Actinoplanes aureus]|uniref:Excreted virulence factor EspC, type VII ESX diderm n=1 Tax=Actinoplanes aureus TaxID=2792083 RepID=A0A931FY13_9ACTN|nr:type VII secretion target [Actinoplanes aureus]MBG0563307.1 hypothetical protein [Actinoplanes aureus]